MANIGFKTARMERDERMPVKFENRQQEPEITDETIELMMKLRIRKQALALVDGFLHGGLLIDYVKAELQDLRKLYKLTSK